MVTKGKPAPMEKFTPAVKDTYLAKLRETGTVGESCQAAQISRQTVNEHREKYPEFALAEADAMQDYREFMIEAEIRRRAVNGVEEEVYGKDGLLGTRTKYSDTLLIFHAKRHIPEYRDAPIQITQTSVSLQVGELPQRLRAHDEERRALMREVMAVDYAQVASGKVGNSGEGSGNGHGNGNNGA